MRRLRVPQNPDTPAEKPTLQSYTIDLNQCGPMVGPALYPTFLTPWLPERAQDASMDLQRDLSFVRKPQRGQTTGQLALWAVR